MAFADLIGTLDGRRPAPLYQQLSDAIRDAIRTRALKANEALPAERELAQVLTVSRITVRKALDALEAEGLLTRRQGAGTFVASRVEKSFSRLTSFTEDMAARGWIATSVWINRIEGQATPEESMTLGLSPGAPLYRFQRVRFADGSPMALEYSTVPADRLPSIEAVDRSLYEALAAEGNRPVRALQRLRAVPFTAEQAALLKVQPGAAGLMIERRGFGADGRPVEVTQSFYRGDAYDFVAELTETAP